MGDTTANIASTSKYLIIDDELPGRELIALHLTQFPEFEVIASCNSAIEAHHLHVANRLICYF